MYFVAQRPPSTQLSGFTLWHNRRRATQLCKFTLWHNGRRVKSTRFDACTRCRTYFPKTVTNHAEKYEGSIQSKILLRLFDFSKLFKDERFGRVSKHRSIVDLQQTLEITFYLLFIQQTFKRWTLYEDRIADLSKRLKDEHWGHTVHQSKAKRKQAPQSEAKMCRHKCNLKKPRLLIAQDTQ